MKHCSALLLTIGLVFGIVSCDGNRELRNRADGYPFEEYSEDELRRDFDQFRKVLERKTVGLYTDRDELQTLLDEAEQSIRGTMNELEFYRLLAPIMAELRCGHSFLSVSSGLEKYMRETALLFPLEVRFFDDRIFTIADRNNTGISPGSEIISINGRSAREIIHMITGNMSTDGQDTGRPRYDGERWFAAMYFSYLDSSGEFRLQVTQPENETLSEIIIAGVHDVSLAKTAKGVMFDTANTPYTASVHEKYAILSIPTFNLSDTKAFAEFLKEFFARVEDENTDSLILDLRGNYGGTPVPTVEVFRYLIEEPLPFFDSDNPFFLNRWKKPIEPAVEAFDGQLFVLMDEAGFSMNSFLLSLLQYHEIGTLVGTTSSGGFMCSDASREKTLRNTGLRMRYSTRVFKTAVEGHQAGVGINPDISVEWTLDDFLNHNDPVMERVLNEIFE